MDQLNGFRQPGKVVQDYNRACPPEPGTWRRWYAYPFPQFVTDTTADGAQEIQIFQAQTDSDFVVQMLAYEFFSTETANSPLFTLVDGRSNYPFFKVPVPLVNGAGYFRVAVEQTGMNRVFGELDSAGVLTGINNSAMPFVLPHRVVIPARSQAKAIVTGLAVADAPLTLVLHGYKSFPPDPAYSDPQFLRG